MASRRRDFALQAREVTPPTIQQPVVAYPGWNVMSQQSHWDDATRRVILARVHDIPPIRFFDEHEVRTLTLLAERVLPQNDRSAEERIPIVPWIDQRCFDHVVEGWRFDDMPSEGEAWRMGLRGIDDAALTRFGRKFNSLNEDEQNSVLRLIATGHPPGETWQYLSAQRFWIYIVLRQMCGIYYAHPSSWNEIGFGGPAYPRGYFALNHGYPEPWEAREVRLDAASD